MLDQSGINWLKHRKKGMGSSDIPTLFGYNEYHTCYSLWLDKTSKKTVDKESNFIQQQGHDLEKVAREKFNLLNGRNFEPKLIVREGGPFRISLDGFEAIHMTATTASSCEIMEIKYVGKEFNVIPPNHHLWQMQYQLMVSGAIKCFYVMINDAKEIKSMEILPDLDMQADIQDRVLKFWELVKSKTPPPFCKDDTLPLDKSKITLIRKYLRNEKRLKVLKEISEKLKDEILKDAKKLSYRKGKLKITYSEKKGNINYEIVPQLKDVDLEPYRKSPSGSWAIKELKNKG
jgi:putative phage-type endonuclease